jgi:hypothetical protein
LPFEADGCHNKVKSKALTSQRTPKARSRGSATLQRAAGGLIKYGARGSLFSFRPKGLIFSATQAGRRNFLPVAVAGG